jgi:hypothetical protein
LNVCITLIVFARTSSDPLLIVIRLRGNVYPRTPGIAAATLPADALALSARHTFRHRRQISKQRKPRSEPHKSMTKTLLKNPIS